MTIVDRAFYLATVDEDWVVAITNGSSVFVAVCYQTRQRPGCRRELQLPPGGSGPAVGIWGVTADSNGVYADAEYPLIFGNFFALIYWPGGKGTGTFVNGFRDTIGSTISFDGLHNLLAMDGTNLYVYSGCPSACVEHGPFPLHTTAHDGSLGNGETTFMTLGSTTGGISQIDVYQYNGTSGITYLYSNKNGFNASSTPVGIAQRLN